MSEVEEQVEAIDGLIERAAEIAAETRILPQMRLNVPYGVFEVFRLRLGEEPPSFQKCSCGSCGNLVAFFDMVISDEDDHDGGVIVGFVRVATEEETVAYLEEIPE